MHGLLVKIRAPPRFLHPSRKVHGCPGECTPERKQVFRRLAAPGASDDYRILPNGDLESCLRQRGSSGTPIPASLTEISVKGSRGETSLRT
jgi:hypothetical protein